MSAISSIVPTCWSTAATMHCLSSRGYSFTRVLDPIAPLHATEKRCKVRGHYALGGKPAFTRLQEQNWFALPSVLDRLESFARHPLGSTPVEVNSCIRVLGRNGYIPNLRYRQKVFLTETLEGLEARSKEGRVYLLRNYRKFS